MKRIIMHWTAGSHKANDLDKKHYHVIFEGDGNIVYGSHAFLANKSPLEPGKYAAHTLNCNSDSIGLAVACMLHAVENQTFGKYPMTEKQFEAMCKYAADLCKLFGIPVTEKTVLSHAEVQSNLGIKQRGKWDFTVLPFKPELKGAKACGDYMRTRVQYYMQPDISATDGHDEPANKPYTLWQWICWLFGVKK